METLIARQAYHPPPSLSPPATGQPLPPPSRTPLVFPFVPPVAWATSPKPGATKPSSSTSPPTHEQTFAIRSLSAASIPSLAHSKRNGTDQDAEDKDFQEAFSDDPFFSRYGSAQSDDPQQQQQQQPRRKKPIRAQDIRVIPNDGQPGNSFSEEVPATTKDVKSPRTVRVNVLILGAHKVGKTTFIKRAPALNSAAGECTGCRHFLVDGTSYHANLIEGPADAIDSGFLDREHLSKVDGAVVLFDAMNEKSLDSVPHIVEALKAARKSVLLVSSKTDCHATDAISRLADVEERARGYVNGMDIPQVSIFSLESFQCIMSTLIRDMTLNKKGDPDTRPVSIVSTRKRAKSIAHASTFPTKSHQRSNSDGSDRSALKPSASYHAFSTLHENGYAAQRADPPRRSGTRSPTKLRPRPSIALNTKTSLVPPKAPISRSPTSFLDLRESIDFDRTLMEDSQGPDAGNEGEHATDVNVVEQSPASLKQLVDRLLSSSTTDAKAKFIINFLTFYRFFAAPSKLLSSIFKHYRRTSSVDSRYRVLNILEEWVQIYPGDFAHLSTRQKLANFLSKVDESEPRLKAAASQILVSLETSVSEDDDTDWACSDSGHALAFKHPGSEEKALPKTPPQAPAYQHEPIYHRRISDAQTFFDFSRSSFDEPTISPTTIQSPSKPTEFDEKLIFSSDTLRTLNAIGPNSQANQLPQSLFSTQSMGPMSDSAQRQAALLGGKAGAALSKNTWRTFMAQPDEAIAREITRIDWILFGAIRPRDMIRHATVSMDERHRYPALANVTRAVDHFNHLAYWVAGLILLRDKAKHRAEMLEKLMRVARRLRQMNNYNALGAFVAAVKSCPIARLNQTKELVREETRRDFCKLEILMGTHRGGSAYRMAWENTRTERIPFLFSHRRDLVVVECGNKTFVDASDAQPTSPSKSGASNDSTPAMSPKQASSRPIPIPSASNPPSPRTKQSSSSSSSDQLINFPKFTLMGETLAQLTAAQAMPYPGLVQNEDVRALLLDVLVDKDDEVLYQRSLTLEPPTNASASNGSGSESALRGTLRRWAGIGG